MFVLRYILLYYIREKSVLLRHMGEKHNGKTVTFKMNVESMHQNNALSRQCNEAVRIKEVNPNERINNKEEFHQPGDIEVT